MLDSRLPAAGPGWWRPRRNGGAVTRKSSNANAEFSLRDASADQPLASVEAGPVRVEIVRSEGSQTLCMRATVAGANREVSVSAQTSDLMLARSRARAFADALQRNLESGIDECEGLIQPATYATLLGRVATSFADAPNYRTVIRAWMRYRGYTPENGVGLDFTAEFKSWEEGFRKDLYKSGKSAATVNSYLSRARKLGLVVAEIVVATSDLSGFTAAFRAGLAASGMSKRAFARALGVGLNAVLLWWSGKQHPRHRADLVPRMEELFGMREGELARHLVHQPKPKRSETCLSARLKELAKERGVTPHAVARAVGIRGDTFLAWYSGRCEPATEHRESTIPDLEEYFGVEPDALLELLSPVRVDQLPYRWTLTAEQAAEWNRFVEHKTSRTELRRDHKPKAYWRKTDKGCGSAKYRITFVQRYFGFLSLPVEHPEELMRGRGCDGASLSLCDLARLDDLLGFVQFVARRSCAGRPELVYNSQILSVLEFVRSLVRAGTGYLWQAHGIQWHRFPAEALQLGEGVKPDGSLQQWRQHCERVHAELTETLASLNENKDHLIVATRDYEHIEAILSMDRPMDALCELFLRMQKDYASRARRVGVRRRAVMARNLLFVAMIIRNPLRREHWREMTYRADGTGTLRRQSDGSWTLFIPKADFKALAGFRRHDYVAVLAPELGPMIADYLENHRKHLFGADSSDLLFLGMNQGRGKGSVIRLNSDAVLQDLTARYLKHLVTRGFRPHALRHIIATHLVRNHKDGIDRAADALHNTREMILKTYGHIRGIDLTKKSHEIIEAELKLGFEALNE